MLLRTALAFFVLALISGVSGFFGLPAGSASVIQTLFFTFLSGFLVMLMLGLATERTAAG